MKEKKAVKIKNATTLRIIFFKFLDVATIIKILLKSLIHNEYIRLNFLYKKLILPIIVFIKFILQLFYTPNILH